MLQISSNGSVVRAELICVEATYLARISLIIAIVASVVLIPMASIWTSNMDLKLSWYAGLCVGNAAVCYLVVYLCCLLYNAVSRIYGGMRITFVMHEIKTGSSQNFSNESEAK